MLGAGWREDTQPGRGYPVPPTPLLLAGKGPNTLSGPSAGGGDTWGSPGSHNLASASDLGVSRKKATSIIKGHLLYSESSGIVQFTCRTSLQFLFSPSFTEEKAPFITERVQRGRKFRRVDTEGMSGPWSYETTVFLQKQGCLQRLEQGAGERLLKRAGETTIPSSADLCCGQATAEARKQPQREQTHVGVAAFPRNSISKRAAAGLAHRW